MILLYCPGCAVKNSQALNGLFLSSPSRSGVGAVEADEYSLLSLWLWLGGFASPRKAAKLLASIALSSTSATLRRIVILRFGLPEGLCFGLSLTLSERFDNSDGSNPLALAVLGLLSRLFTGLEKAKRVASLPLKWLLP